MTVTIKLWGQLKQLTSKESCAVSIGSDDNLDKLIQQLAADETAIAHFLVDDSNKPSNSILVFINGQQHVWGAERQINDTDDITLMSPIAGG